MRSRLPKVLHPVCGVPMLQYVLDAAVSATGSRPLVVVSPAVPEVRAAFESVADFAVQEQQRGTGDAVRAALEVLPATVREVVVMSGDVPLVSADLVTALLGIRRELDAALVLASVEAIDPTGLGRVLRDEEGTVLAIVEEKDASEDEQEIHEINAGLYAFDARWLRRRLPDVPPSPTTGELYLTHLVELARADGEVAEAVMLPDDGSLTGINDRVQLAEVETIVRRAINDAYMREGVTMVDPARVIIDTSARIAEDVILEPDVAILGTSVVGRDTRIGAGTTLVDSTVGERCLVRASVLESSTVGDDVRIGPFAHLRPGARVGDGAEVGNYAEIKAATLGARSKQHHFSYLGDAEIGEDVNIGAGTITANYDGQRKHRTVIGDRAFIGSDTILRAPVTVGEGGMTGAGAVVTHDVAPGQVVVGVPARPATRQQTAEVDPDRTRTT
ncbi:MAG: bifunctional UDP-N-acetylglucosamine diphosphorylase/glucosamine-1-phosphate N-acetyltransferase GlmU [Chloroflexi bacterium]|nr:bifunctional UDP-N-acetylglucosamine diphosphorylase/glucosamine-1-phosphate N-acetyltransferase GlmU [Chloroflexota bacterium]